MISSSLFQLSNAERRFLQYLIEQVNPWEGILYPEAVERLGDEPQRLYHLLEKGILVFLGNRYFLSPVWENDEKNSLSSRLDVRFLMNMEASLLQWWESRRSPEAFELEYHLKRDSWLLLLYIISRLDLPPYQKNRDLLTELGNWITQIKEWLDSRLIVAGHAGESWIQEIREALGEIEALQKYFHEKAMEEDLEIRIDSIFVRRIREVQFLRYMGELLDIEPDSALWWDGKLDLQTRVPVDYLSTLPGKQSIRKVRKQISRRQKGLFQSNLKDEISFPENDGLSRDEEEAWKEFLEQDLDLYTFLMEKAIREEKDLEKVEQQFVSLSLQKHQYLEEKGDSIISKGRSYISFFPRS